MQLNLDLIDLKILQELQSDGRMTNVELAERVGISAPPCLRRVRKLEDAGYIKQYRAILSAQALGYSLSAFCSVGLKRQSELDLKSFSDLVQQWPLVRDAWMISGESDFLIHCVAKDLPEFQNFVLSSLTAAGNVDTVRTMLTIRRVKEIPSVDLDRTLKRSDPRWNHE